MKVTLVSQTGNLLASEKGETSKILSAHFVGVRFSKDAAQEVLFTHLPRAMFPKGMEEGDVFEIEVTIQKVEAQAPATEATNAAS
jgi:hypothetical protein